MSTYKWVDISFSYHCLNNVFLMYANTLGIEGVNISKRFLYKPELLVQFWHCIIPSCARYNHHYYALITPYHHWLWCKKTPLKNFTVILFLFVCLLIPSCVRGYFWIHMQGSLLAGLRRTYGLLKMETRSATWKSRTFLSISLSTISL